MRRKILSVMMLLTFSMTSIFPSHASTVPETQQKESCKTDTDEFEHLYACELTKQDLCTSPAKKTLRIGQSFCIGIFASNDSEYEDISDEAWDELTEENIESITYYSKKSSVASVDGDTGKVTACKKGAAVIVSHVCFVNGETANYKTKVYVTH